MCDVFCYLLIHLDKIMAGDFILGAPHHVYSVG
jgi:hypothetical protein